MRLSRPAALAFAAALLISLSLNFVWLGYLGSQYLRSLNAPTVPERTVSLGDVSVPAPLRQAMTAKFDADRARLRVAYRDIRLAREAAVAAMRRNPYDEMAIRAALSDLRAKIEVAAGIGADAIVAALADVSPETRAAIEPPPKR